MNLFLKKLAASPLPWLKGNDPTSGIAISSRIRLARNLKGYQFPRCLDSDSKAEIIDKVFEAAEFMPLCKKAAKLEVENLKDNEKKLLLERKNLTYESLINDDCGVILDNNEDFSILINDDDHIHLQSIKAGLSLSEAWSKVEKIDDGLSKSVNFSFNNDYGYLTSSPANVGTGMKASVYLDLTASLISGQLPGIKQACKLFGHVFLGENSEDDDYCGSRFFISTRKTLGLTETAVIEEFEDFIKQIIDSEMKARRKLIADHPEKLLNHISRAYGNLKYSCLLTEEEAVELLYTLRTGTELSLFDHIEAEDVNRLLVMSGDAHLQNSLEASLDLESLDVARANFLKSQFNLN